MHSKRIHAKWLLTAILVFAGIPLFPSAEEQAAQVVPQAHKQLYSDLSTRIKAFADNVSQLKYDDKFTPVFGAEMLGANAHRGEELLTPQCYAGNLYILTRLQALGVKGVTIQIAYPILSDFTPRSSEYLDFYVRLATEIHKRGMKLHVKSGMIFPQAEFSSMHMDYSKITTEAVFAECRKYAKVIIERMTPEYYTIINEPTTAAAILGRPVTVEECTQHIKLTIESVSSPKTLMGAGSGTWEKEAYMRAFAEIPGLDFLDMHIYPVATPMSDCLAQAARFADMAISYKKKAVIGECWLYKADIADLTGGPIQPALFARDVFSFWSPLDSAFLASVATMARAKRIEYISPFWSKYLFAYVDYTEELAAKKPGELLRLGDQAAAKNILAGTYSPTGEGYRRLIADMQPPTSKGTPARE